MQHACDCSESISGACTLSCSITILGLIETAIETSRLGNVEIVLFRQNVYARDPTFNHAPSRP